MRVWLAALAALLLGSCARHVPPGTIELVYASPYSPMHPFSRADITWMKWVEQRSGGKLRIRPVWSGALLSSDQSMDEIRHGVADLGLVTPVYSRGGTQLIRIQSGFYSGALTPQTQVELYHCLVAASPEFDHELRGLKVLAVQGGSLPGLVTRNRPIRTLDDLRGLRLRAPSETLAVLRELGVDPVNMPMGEVYSAMAKGVIDGVVAPADTFRSLHFSEVAHHFTALAVPRGAYPSRVIGQKSWDRLPPEAQRILEESSPVWEAALAHEVMASVDQGFDAAKKDKVSVLPISPADQARFDTLYLADAARNAAGLKRYGIDGMAVFKAARGSIRPDGSVRCGGAA